MSIINVSVIKRALPVFCCMTVLSGSFTQLSASGTSGATMLKYMPGPRQHALGGSGTAVKKDLNSVNYNPAVLATVKKLNVSLLYENALTDAKVFYLGVSKELKFAVSAFTLLVYHGGSIEVNDRFDELHGKKLTAQSDYVLSFAVSKELFSDLYIGVMPRYFISTLLEKYKASVISFDTGVYWNLGLLGWGNQKRVNRMSSEGLSIGAAVKNLGGKVKYDTVADPIPMILTGGISYPVKISRMHKVVVYSDVLKCNEDMIRIGTGIEYINSGLYYARVGYKINYNIKNLCMGLGLSYKGLGLDYSMLLNSVLNNQHQIMLSFSTGKMRKRGKTVGKIKKRKSKKDKKTTLKEKNKKEKKKNKEKKKKIKKRKKKRKYIKR